MSTIAKSEVGSGLEDLSEFYHVFENRDEYRETICDAKTCMVVYFTAGWCKPCRAIKPLVLKMFRELKERGFTCYVLDVDDNFDVFANMKSKKMVKAIPSILGYGSRATDIYPDASLIGAKSDDVEAFYNDIIRLT